MRRRGSSCEVVLKIVVLSDSHGRAARLHRVLALHRDAALICYLGDGLADIADAEARYGIPVYAVCGNCDRLPEAQGVPDTRVVIREGHRILLTHGHRYGVKYGDGGLISAALAHECDIALFGHTHYARETYLAEEGLLLCNPGSVGAPREGAPSYGILTLDGRNALFSHGTVSDGYR